MLRLHTVFVCKNLYVKLVGVIVPSPKAVPESGRRRIAVIDLSLRIERRIDVAKVIRLVFDELPQNIEIIAVVEFFR